MCREGISTETERKQSWSPKPLQWSQLKKGLDHEAAQIMTLDGAERSEETELKCDWGGGKRKEGKVHEYRGV